MQTLYSVLSYEILLHSCKFIWDGYFMNLLEESWFSDLLRDSHKIIEQIDGAVGNLTVLALLGPQALTTQVSFFIRIRILFILLRIQASSFL